MRFLFCVFAASLVAACGPSVDAEAAAAGEKVFQRNCSGCHITEIAPSLDGVIGREAGSVANFAYSDAMRGSTIVWDKETLSRFLQDPEAVVPGTNMAFAGITEEESAQVAEYLLTR